MPEKSKFHSAMGFLLGDMLGSPFEGFSHTAAAEGYLKKIGSYTDDTLLFLSVLKAFSKHKPLCKTLIEYYSESRGFGGRMDAMLSKRRCVPSDSWGNGAAVRTAALALFDHATLKDAADFCKATHTHPESIACSKAVFLAVRQALRKKQDLSECWEALGQRLKISHYSMGIRAGESIPPALIVFEESSSFQETLQKAILLGGDTDSIGALAGALAGAYYGVPKEFSSILEKENKMTKEMAKYIP
jgi:ADP-ribosylglycohydrolase